MLMKMIEIDEEKCNTCIACNGIEKSSADASTDALVSCDKRPLQIMLAPLSKGYYNDAKLLVAADCSAFAYKDFHEKFNKGRTILIGCPKLDGLDYSERLCKIINDNDLKSVTVVRMDVPCCYNLEHAAYDAMLTCKKIIPYRVYTISSSGKIVE